MSTPLLADEDFRGAIVRGVRIQQQDIDLERTQDVGLSGVADSDVLAWAADNTRVLLTHDRNTMVEHAYDRVRNGLPMPCVFIVSRRMSIRQAIEEIVLIAGASFEGEYDGQVRYLPLK